MNKLITLVLLLLTTHAFAYDIVSYNSDGSKTISCYSKTTLTQFGYNSVQEVPCPHSEQIKFYSEQEGCVTSYEFFNTIKENLAIEEPTRIKWDNSPEALRREADQIEKNQLKRVKTDNVFHRMKVSGVCDPTEIHFVTFRNVSTMRWR